MSGGTGSDVAGRDVRARVLVCPDKFRGSLTAVQAAEALADGLRAGGVPQPRILPVADGGEGTVACCLAAGFTEFRRRVRGADGHPVQALGARLTDSRGNPAAHGGGGLAALEQADLTELDPRLAECDPIAATDVGNPLLGARGAAAVFAPQKGAGRLARAQLEQGLAKLADLLDRPTVPRFSDLPGAGAGGGIAYALITAGARRVSGAGAVLEMLCFADHACAAELIVTGEGSLDASSLGGKAPVTLARTAHRLRTRVVAVEGRSTLTPQQQQREAGIDRVYQLLDLAGSAERSLREAPLLPRRAGTDIAAWLAGQPRRPLRVRRDDP